MPLQPPVIGTHQAAVQNLPGYTLAGNSDRLRRVPVLRHHHPRPRLPRPAEPRDLSGLVGALATRSPQFRTRWAAHDVRLHHAGVKHFRHPVVGMIEVAYNSMDLPAEPGLALTFYTAELGSPSEDTLRLLASWAATIPESDRQTADQHTIGAASQDRST